MRSHRVVFDEHQVVHQLKHYLPSQSPLKDFIHHNTLHAFQDQRFEFAIRKASRVFGYKVSLSVEEFRGLYFKNKVHPDILERSIRSRKDEESVSEWLDNLLYKQYDSSLPKKIGRFHRLWKETYHLDLNTIVHTNLFRILNSYLDQGIAIDKFPIYGGGLLASVRKLESNSLVSFFKTRRSRDLLMDETISITGLLDLLVGDATYYYQYLFDQQFAHPGWSGLVATIEDNPGSLLDGRKITLRELIILELLLELDNLDNALKGRWNPLAQTAEAPPLNLFEAEEFTELDEVLTIWQEAYEWTYYDQVLTGIRLQKKKTEKAEVPGFQAFFCLDDREASLRRYIEHFDPSCKTYATPGHFAVDTYYQPKNGKFFTKICPAPLSPTHLIKEVAINRETGSEVHFTKTTHSLFRGWLITQTLGFWSAIRLLFTIFKPGFSPASSSSFLHMGGLSTLTVENRSPSHKQSGLQIGFTVEEMVDRVEAVLKSTGLVTNFAPLVYLIGHGSSSANNTHYAGYDCGACSGRPGSANARAFSYMANHSEVRKRLKGRGIVIPEETEFLGGLHDTTRDEIFFYDEELLSPDNALLHERNISTFRKALQLNAKERSRRFESVDTKRRPEYIHEKLKMRSVALFEPRPELNHATNALCIIGRRQLTDQVFLDRRAFMNSYDYRIDPEGYFLESIINAATPVCGGINLEYYFSRVDNEKLGAGSKLPHNVMGLIGVANGFEGDLRPGLPQQMIEVHDPIRLLILVEQFPEVVLKTIMKSPSTYEWFINEWVILVVIHPETRAFYRFRSGGFAEYCPVNLQIESLVAEDLLQRIESETENLPVYILK